jgi:hypothetical protein
MRWLPWGLLALTWCGIGIVTVHPQGLDRQNGTIVS